MSQISPQKSSISFKSSSRPNPVQHYVPWLYAFWKFSRPHTIMGTTLSVVGLYAIAVSESRTWNLGGEIGVLLLTLLTCLCGNVYIVGLNQLEDVGIDQINKPHLPLASGEFSRREAQMIVGITGLLAIALAALQGIYLFIMVGLSVLIGTAYSLPPLRLKRFLFWASFCIFTVRGVVINLGLFLHFVALHGNQPVSIPGSVWALTLFVLGFTFAIAIFKDIPDLEGDRRYHINTLTIRLGQRAVFALARWVLTVCYVGMAIAAPWIVGVHRPFLIATHLLALGTFWVWSIRVNLAEPRQIAQFYQFIWKLFFLEYLIFPAACLLG